MEGTNLLSFHSSTRILLYVLRVKLNQKRRQLFVKPDFLRFTFYPIVISKR